MPRANDPPSKSWVAVGLSAAVVGIIYGYDTGAMAGALLFVTPEFGLGSFEQGLVSAAITMGSILGAILAHRLCDRFGRKPTMISVALAYMVFGVLSGLAPTYEALVASRLLLGIAVGVSIVVAPVFVGESAPRRSRGKLLVAFQLATTLGIASAYFTDLLLSAGGHWRWMLGLAAVPAALVAVLLLRLPETPHWYLMHGDLPSALVSMRRTRPEPDVEPEIEEINQKLADTSRSTVRELFSGPFRRAGTFVVGLGFFVQITGISAIVAFSPVIFQEVGFASDQSAILVTSLVQLAAIVGELVALLLVDRAGRRRTLSVGIGAMAFANVVLTLVFLTGVGPGAPAVVAVVGVVLFRIGYSAGLGSLIWVYASEALPSRIRSMGASAMLTTNLVANSLVSLAFLPALRAMGGAVSFGAFLVLCLAALVFVLRFAPETRGRGLEEITGYWQNGARWLDVPARRERKVS